MEVGNSETCALDGGSYEVYKRRGKVSSYARPADLEQPVLRGEGLELTFESGAGLTKPKTERETGRETGRTTR